LRVLTFNSHQPYVHLLAGALTWQWGVVTPKTAAGKILAWDPAVRPRPENVRTFTSVAEAMSAERWDWVLVHNLNDLLDTKGLELPRLFLVHGTVSGRLLQDRAAIEPAEYLANLGKLLDVYACGVIYISELKRNDWGLPGRVIRHGVDLAAYNGYRGDRKGLLLVANHLNERGVMLGWETYAAVCRDMPHVVLGRNPRLLQSRAVRDWDDLKEQYRSWQVYLYTPVYPFEDGYNLALLEAMATGMPVATIAHPTSPVRDGIEGVVAGNTGELRKRVEALLESPEQACRMGRNARQRPAEVFPISGFASGWEAAAAQAVGSNRQRQR